MRTYNPSAIHATAIRDAPLPTIADRLVVTMNKDIRLSVSFFHHPKTIKLQSLLGSEVVLSLLRLWCYAGQWKPSGNLEGMNQEEIEGAALYVGNPGMFVQVLLDVKFLNADLTLHDWQEHNPWAAGSLKRSDMARFSRMADTHPKIFKDLRDKGVNAVSRKEYEALTEPQRNVNEPLTKVVTNRLTPSPSPAPSQEPTPLSPKAATSYPEWFEAWWNLYPARKGKKAGKKTTFTLSKMIPETDREDLITATENYSKDPESVNGFAKDPERFLKNDYWRDFIEKPDPGNLDNILGPASSSKNREGFA